MTADAHAAMIRDLRALPGFTAMRPEDQEAAPFEFPAVAKLAIRAALNQAYVRVLLADKQPEFAAVLTAAERLLDAEGILR